MGDFAFREGGEHACIHWDALERVWVCIADDVRLFIKLNPPFKRSYIPKILSTSGSLTMRHIVTPIVNTMLIRVEKKTRVTKSRTATCLFNKGRTLPSTPVYQVDHKKL